MNRCKRCGKLLFINTSSDMLCKSCSQEIEKERLREDARQIAEARALYESVKAQKTALDGGLSQTVGAESFRKRADSIDAYAETLKQLVRHPKIAAVISADSVNIVGGSILINGIGLVPFDYRPNGEIDVHFQSAIDQAVSNANRCRITAENSERFLSDLRSLRTAQANIVQDTGEWPPSPLHLLKTKNVTQRTPLSKVSSFISVDVETTGLHPERDEIVEVAAIRFQSFQPISCFHSFVKPRHGLRPEAVKVNGITWDKVINAPHYEQISDSLNDFIGDCLPIVGHNLAFDYSFLTARGAASQYISENRAFFDTLELSRREFSVAKSFKLSALCLDVLNISTDVLHCADADALCAGYLFREICRRRIGI